MEIISFNLLYPERLIYLIPLAIVLFIIMRLNLVKIKEPDAITRKKLRKRRKIYKTIVFFSRLIALACLVIAIAGPSIETRKSTQGDKTLHILVDNSASMDVFGKIAIQSISANLEADIPVKMSYMAQDERSNIGDGILANLGMNKNFLIVTDARNNYGSDLNDVFLLAEDLNATISLLELERMYDDLSVEIKGPSKVIENVDATYSVLINGVESNNELLEYNLIVKIDGATVINERGTKPEFTFTKKFSEGYHRIEASIEINDYFSQNNVFYKSVHVIHKPDVALVGGANSPLHSFLEQLYTVTTTDSIPESLDDYYVAIIDDVNVGSLGSWNTQKLMDYLIEGNGLLVVGGHNSFEYGGYKNSMFSSILPVDIGAGEVTPKPDLNAIILIDISPGKDPAMETVPLAKAYSLDLLEQFSANDNVGVIAFAGNAYLVSPMSKIYQKNMADVRDKISRLTYKCESQYTCSNVIIAFKRAIEQLDGTSGRKWIFLLSDGVFLKYKLSFGPIYTQMISKNIVTYPIAVGKLFGNFKTFTKIIDIPFLRKLAERTGGTLFGPHTDDATKVRLIFDRNKDEEGIHDDGSRTLVVLDEYHFITEDIEPTASIYGYNQVIPKSIGRLLMTTTMGEPLLITRYYGAGRVAALATDDGSSWAGNLFNKENSRLMSRIINWAIGNPERKEDYYISVDDTRVNESTKVYVKSKALPKLANLHFNKDEGLGDNIYTSSVMPKQTGFDSSISGIIYGVNYKHEYDGTGVDESIYSIIESAGGKVFKPSEHEEIVNHVISSSIRSNWTEQKIIWPFIALALAILLIEMIMRRIWEYRE